MKCPEWESWLETTFPVDLDACYDSINIGASDTTCSTAMTNFNANKVACKWGKTYDAAIASTLAETAATDSADYASDKKCRKDGKDTANKALYAGFVKDEIIKCFNEA